MTLIVAYYFGRCKRRYRTVPVSRTLCSESQCQSGCTRPIVAAGFGADCVSVGEIRAALKAGFPAEKIFFAGVGKSDSEIDFAFDAHIGCFNVESLPELELIADMASNKSVIANVALRVNPDIDAHTHHYITTGLEENKFGIALEMLDDAIALCLKQPNLRLCGLHFHIDLRLHVWSHIVCFVSVQKN